MALPDVLHGFLYFPPGLPPFPPGLPPGLPPFPPGLPPRLPPGLPVGRSQNRFLHSQHLQPTGTGKGLVPVLVFVSPLRVIVQVMLVGLLSSLNPQPTFS